jgi:hypothetical protein
VPPKMITWAELEARLADLERIKVRVGVFGAEGGAAFADDEGKITTLGLAAIQELGLGVPRRSFIVAGVEHFAEKIAEVQRKISRKILAGEMTARTAANVLGAYAVGRIRAYVFEHPLDPGWANAPSTIERKGSDRPLVDTGRLLASLSYQVVES